MNTRQALEASKQVTTDALSAAIATLRERLDTHMQITADAWKSDDLEIVRDAALNVHHAAQALAENLEMQSMSRATVREADTPALVKELERRATKEDDPVAAAALATLPKKKGKAHVRT